MDPKLYVSFFLVSLDETTVKINEAVGKRI